MSLFHSSFGIKEVEEILRVGSGRLSFLGLLGAGMEPLAKLLSKRGFTVEGSDRNATEEQISRLKSEGITLYREGESDPEGSLALVYSLAVSENSEELLKALKASVPVMSRAQLLGGVVNSYKRRIAVSGTHGKSTVTAMLHRIFEASGFGPTVISGAPLMTGEHLAIGNGEYIIYESCEYKDSFLYSNPETQLVTSVEMDHPDYFENIEAVKRSFLAAMKNAESAVVARIDDPNIKALLGEVEKRKITYGKDSSADLPYRVISETEKGSVFEIDFKRISLSLMGEYNVENASAAYAVSRLYGVPRGEIKDALESFRSIERRLEELGRVEKRRIFCDYAHHPTAIKATIHALKSRFGMLTVIFKPHTYTRTKALWSDFVTALREADYSVILDVYPAREKSIAGVSAERLSEEIGRASVYLTLDRLANYVFSSTEGVVLIMGAGGLLEAENEIMNYKEIKD